MGRRAASFPPMARDRTGRVRLQWGPRLTSGSGAPSFGTAWTDPRDDVGRSRPKRSRVRLPARAGVLLGVAVNDVLQREGRDYLVVGQALDFRRLLVRESAPRRLARALGASRSAPAVDRVDVWIGSEGGIVHLHDLRIRTTR